MPFVNTDDPIFRSLWEGLPHYSCDAGCTACCKGVVSLSLPELIAIERFGAEQAGGLETLANAGSPTGCPFRTDAGCPIYPVRPFMCRLFGFRFLHPDLAGQPFCPRRMLIRPGDAEAKKYKFYLDFCEENGFAIIGRPRDPSGVPAIIAENRAMAARFPDLGRFAFLMAREAPEPGPMPGSGDDSGQD